MVWGLLVLFGCFQSVTGDVQLDDDRVMDQAVDRGRRRHWILKNLLPLGKRQVAADQETAAFVALGQQREQHFHLVPALLDIAQVVDKYDNDIWYTDFFGRNTFF